MIITMSILLFINSIQYSIIYIYVQSLDMNTESKSGVIIQFIIPFLAVTIEAFVFCFAGEYLSTKVSILHLFL